MRLFSIALAMVASLVLSIPAHAGSRHPGVRCLGDACKTLHRGHPRGRIPIACVHIPFVKRSYGQVALFVLRDFHVPGSPEDLQAQLARAVWKDSKVTGPVDDFCRNPKFFAPGTAIVLCDEHSFGWIAGDSLRYAIRTGWPPGKRRVHIGTGV